MFQSNSFKKAWGQSIHFFYDASIGHTADAVASLAPFIILKGAYQRRN